MPNWVTNKINAPPHVIRGMMNGDGRIDFNTAAPFQGPSDWDGIYGDAETAAKHACGLPLNKNPLIAMLEDGNRSRINIRTMSEESFEQFIGMLRNYRACGYLHSMQFARDVWGTKWNACEPTADPDAGECAFETAWSCPVGVLKKVSKRFPDDLIAVTYADEDIGSNCGTFSLKAGAVVAEDIAPPWRDMSDDEKEKWRAFAYAVTGRSPEPDEDN